MPTTLTGLLLFVVFLLPGFAYLVGKERNGTERQTSPFRETVAVVAMRARHLRVAPRDRPLLPGQARCGHPGVDPWPARGTWGARRLRRALAPGHPGGRAVLGAAAHRSPGPRQAVLLRVGANLGWASGPDPAEVSLARIGDASATITRSSRTSRVGARLGWSARGSSVTIGCTAAGRPATESRWLITHREGPAG